MILHNIIPTWCDVAKIYYSERVILTSHKIGFNRQSLAVPVSLMDKKNQFK